MRLKTILPAKLGFGTAPLGNMFRDLPDAEARATVAAAWNDGIRCFDNAPFYGAGLAELRLGWRWRVERATSDAKACGRACDLGGGREATETALAARVKFTPGLGRKLWRDHLCVDDDKRRLLASASLVAISAPLH